MRDFLAKIQKLPESTRKIILWSIVITIGMGLVILWLKHVQEQLKSFQAEDFKKEFQLEEKIKNFPKIEIPKLEIPEISEEELKKKLEELEKLETEELIQDEIQKKEGPEGLEETIKEKESENP